jgi:hypothetical protein
LARPMRVTSEESGCEIRIEFRTGDLIYATDLGV